MAREKTPAGDYYNKFVIKFLRNQMNNFPKQSTFPIINKVKDYFLIDLKIILKIRLNRIALKNQKML